jgi:hypothetical protein
MPPAQAVLQPAASQPAISYEVTGSPQSESGTHVQISVTLPPGTSLHLTLSAQPGQSPVTVETAETAFAPIKPASRPIQWPSVTIPRWLPLAKWGETLKTASQPLRSRWRWDLPATLFALALIVYLITHAVGLLRYPIYFFSDEAMQPLFAQTLIKNHFFDTRNDIFLPMYVEVDGNRWSPLLPMYFHAVTMTLFGKTALVTRATSALFSILAAIAVSLTLKQTFKVRHWWIGALVLTLMPTWLLHSRTAFETVTATTFYALFLWLYTRYRDGTPRAIFPAVLCAAGAFYSYTNAQAVLAVTGLALLIVDARYHWEQRRTLAWLIPLGVILALPLVIFELRRPDSISLHLRMVNSYWFQDIPFSEKLVTLVQKYANGLSPLYWFFGNEQDLMRHRMGPMPHILTIFLPFFLIGLVVCLRRMRSPAHRTMLLAALAAPAGAAQLNIGVLRVMFFVIPAGVMIVLGWEWLWQAIQTFLQRRGRLKPVVDIAAQWILFYVLGFGSLMLLGNALENGPLWFRNYGLYGMQYGATQLFGEKIPQLLDGNPSMRIIVSPTWANGTHRFAEFFLTPQQYSRVQMGNIDAYLTRQQELPPDLLFVMTPEEFATASSNPKLSLLNTEEVIAFPDGNPGFYLVYWSYSPDADAIFAAEKAERMTLREGDVVIDGQDVHLRYSWIDMGQPKDMFDKDRYTLMRSLEANPMIVELNFPSPRNLSGISADFGAQDSIITATLTLQGQAGPLTFTQTYLGVGDPQVLTLPFEGGPYPVTALHLEFFNLTGATEIHTHVREIELLP